MVVKRGETHLSSPLSEAYRRSAEALNVIGGEVKTEDSASGKIEGTISMSFVSWGENILIEVSGVDNDALVRITSSSRWRPTLVGQERPKRPALPGLDRPLGWRPGDGPFAR
jgi:hypothetical protein